MTDLSAAGAGVGLAVGAAIAPLAAALVAHPPLSSTAHPPSRHPAGGVRLRAAAITVATCVLTGMRVGMRWPLPAFLVFSIGIATLGLCDLHWRVLPIRIVYPAWAVGVAGLALAAGLDHHWSSLADAAIAGAGLFAIFAILHLAVPASIAFGDARLAEPVGTALGWWGGSTVIIGLTAGFVAAAIVSLILGALGRLERRGSIPLGTYLGTGTAIVVWVWHQPASQPLAVSSPAHRRDRGQPLFHHHRRGRTGPAVPARQPTQPTPRLRPKPQTSAAPTASPLNLTRGLWLRPKAALGALGPWHFAG